MGGCARPCGPFWRGCVRTPLWSILEGLRAHALYGSCWRGWGRTPLRVMLKFVAQGDVLVAENKRGQRTYAGG